MQKINIIGTTGSGKSTFGLALAKKLGYEFIELDSLYWQDNWETTSDSDLVKKLKEKLNQPSWILDGNYSRTTTTKWREADTVIWLNYSLAIVLFRAIKRAIIRVVTQQELWGTNNTESFRKLFSNDSIILWTLKTQKKHRNHYRSMIESDHYKHIRFIELSSPRAAKTFLDNIH